MLSTASGIRNGVDTEDARAPAPRPSQWMRALADIASGAGAIHLWGKLGWLDIAQRYRRSAIGPFWLTISMGVMIVSMGALFAGLFKTDIHDYLPFIAISFILWGFIASAVTEGCTAFIAADALIKQSNLPLSLHVFRGVWRNLIILAHNSVIFALLAVYFRMTPSWTWLLAPVGAAFIAVNAVWAGLLLGALSARFRDVPQIAASIMQVFFFLTPIIWQPALVPDRTYILDYNPFYHFLEIVRTPLLGQMPALASWAAVLAMTFSGGAASIAFFALTRRRIAYWV